MNGTRRILLVLLVAVLLPSLSACRVRTGPGGSGGGTQAGAPAGEPGGTPETGAEAGVPGENGETDRGEGAEAGSRTRENPEASRKEYDETAPAEVVPGTDRLLNGEGPGSGAAAETEDAPATGSRLDEGAEESALRTVSAEEAEDKGVSEEAERADSALTYYTVLLEDRGGSLYECQRVNVYWETPGDHVTVHKSSPEHEMILQAGAYDVSARLLPENLRVDDGWVARKNPQVIVKVVDSAVLGSAVVSAAPAEAVCRELARREGWNGIDAVKDRRVLLLSRELLDAPYLRLAAVLAVAKAAYPELYAGEDPAEALRLLSEEATGIIPSGNYFFSEDRHEYSRH